MVKFLPPRLWWPESRGPGCVGGPPARAEVVLGLLRALGHAAPAPEGSGGRGGLGRALAVHAMSFQKGSMQKGAKHKAFPQQFL